MAAEDKKSGKAREGLGKKAQRFYEWFIEGLPGDLRSTAVGAIAAAVATLVLNGIVAAFFSPPPPREIIISTNNQGIARPMQTLLDELKKEKGGLTFAFDPSSLENFYVCEYSYLSAPSVREIVLTYLNKYSMCVSINEIAPASYVVRPNRRSGFLTEESGNWLCKCGG